MTNDLPLVSFIIPCYNQGQFLYDALSSIMLSYSGPKDIIVIDDASTDPVSIRKMEVCVQTFTGITFIRNDNNIGLSASRNKGVRLAKGKYSQFLDSDDLLSPDKINYQVYHFKYCKGLVVSLTDYLVFDETLTNSYAITDLSQYSFSMNDFLYKWERGLTIPIHSALFLTDILLEAPFEETLSGKEDWVFWSRLASQSKRIAFLPIFGAAYRTHSTSMTNNKINEMGHMWLKAANKIENLITNDKPKFMKESAIWYYEHYLPLLKPDEEASCISQEQLDCSIIGENRTVPENPKFTVFIPVYEHFSYLPECLNSVINQTMQNFEIICIDDGSTDARVRALLEDVEARFDFLSCIYHDTNRGISYSSNEMVQKAKGEYLVFLDCDDYLPLNALDLVSKALQLSPKVDYLFTNKINVDQTGNILSISEYGGYPDIKPSENIVDDLMKGMVASHLKVIRKAAIVAVGGFDLSADGVQDYDLALKIAASGTFKYLDKELYYHRQHLSSVTISDSPTQFRKQNIVRRKAFESLFANEQKVSKKLSDLKPADVLEELNKNKEEFCLIYPDDCCFDNLYNMAKQNKYTILDCRGFDIGLWAYRVRDYNSFIDAIITDDPMITIFFMPYLYDPQMIKLLSSY